MEDDVQDDVIVPEQDEETTTDDQPQDGADEGGENTETSEGAAGDGEEEEHVVQIGEEESPASEETKAAPAWVKELRQRQRELAKENAELKAKLSTGQPAAKKAPELPAKPTLASCDYDEDAFAAKLDEWHAQKREIDRHVEAQQAAERQQAEARQKAAQAVHENYAGSKKALKVRDFQEAEDEAIAVLSEVQQNLILHGAANPAAVIYALGKTPKRLQELASIKDPVKFAVAIGKLETEVKVTKRTSTKPAPEQTVRGSGSGTNGKATLERLQAEADKTGDRSKVAAYLRQQRLAGQK